MADGTVDASRSLGVAQANVTLTSDNIYCFGGLSLVKGGQVTVDYSVDLDFITDTALFGLENGPGCDSFVVIADNSGNTVQGGFFLILY